jgi:hypothetical protein
MIVLTKSNWREYAAPVAGGWFFRVPFVARWELSEIARAVFYIPLVTTSRASIEDRPDGTSVMTFRARELTGAEMEEFRAGSWEPVDVIKGTVADVAADIRGAIEKGTEWLPLIFWAIIAVSGAYAASKIFGGKG